MDEETLDESLLKHEGSESTEGDEEALGESLPKGEGHQKADGPPGGRGDNGGWERTAGGCNLGVRKRGFWERGIWCPGVQNKNRNRPREGFPGLEFGRKLVYPHYYFLSRI